MHSSTIPQVAMLHRFRRTLDLVDPASGRRVLNAAVLAFPSFLDLSTTPARYAVSRNFTAPRWTPAPHGPPVGSRR
jgi:hypothetical protein